MLPTVSLQNQVVVALLFEAVFDLQKNIRIRIDVEFDGPFLADEHVKFGFPIREQNTDLGKITLRRCLDKGCFHKAAALTRVGFNVEL